MTSLEHQSDEALCRLVSQWDCRAEETLVSRHHRLVRMCARPYFLAGGDSEDLIQEGMFGLLSAVREYREEKGASFRTYAEFCIRNRLYSAIRAANRDKHTPLNESISFETPFFDGNADLNYSGVQDPEALLIHREEAAERLGLIGGQLSQFEAKVLQYYLDGLSYGEIAAEVRRPAKSVDNAVQRIRRKLARHFTSGDISKG